MYNSDYRQSHCFIEQLNHEVMEHCGCRGEFMTGFIHHHILLFTKLLYLRNKIYYERLIPKMLWGRCAGTLKQRITFFAI